MLLVFAIPLVLVVASEAQEFHGAFGFGTVMAPSATVNSSGIPVPSLSGGLYPSFTGSFILKHHKLKFLTLIIIQKIFFDFL